jgi:T4 RnlA family RNA ligase
MNISLLNEMQEQNYISVQKHQEADLYIYNYTAKAQYDRMWNEITLACRGLIMDNDGRIVSRPFKKFFNLGEYEGQHRPNTSFEVYEKMDGSLGISYLVNGKIQIATRGSFQSDQAKKASTLLYEKYAHCLDKMNEYHTYLFEIIYPENRIVVDYGGEEMLVLLAVIDTHTGTELPLQDIGFPVVKKYSGINDFVELKGLEDNVREGFVIKYSDGYRLKIKFEEYLRLHRIITRVSTVSIWEYLKTGQSLDEILDRVPDEFYEWVKEQKSNFEEKYKAIVQEATEYYKEFDTRKEAALYFQTFKYPSILFSMLDKKDFSDIIWRQLRPVHSRPYINNEEKE